MYFKEKGEKCMMLDVDILFHEGFVFQFSLHSACNSWVLIIALILQKNSEVTQVQTVLYSYAYLYK